MAQSGAQGISKITFIGGRRKGFSFNGPISGKSYEVIPGEPIEVDSRDIAALNLDPVAWEGLPVKSTKE